MASEAERAYRVAVEHLNSLADSARSDDGVQGWEVALACRRFDAAIRAAYLAGGHDEAHGNKRPKWLPDEAKGNP